MEKIDKTRLYANMVGHVPPEIEARIRLGEEVDPQLTQLFETLRLHVLEPDCLDRKTVQLLLFAMMAVKPLDAPTRCHAMAAHRAGATIEELHAVAGLALLVGGMRSYNVAGAAIAEAFATDNEQAQ